MMRSPRASLGPSIEGSAARSSRSSRTVPICRCGRNGSGTCRLWANSSGTMTAADAGPTSARETNSISRPAAGLAPHDAGRHQVGDPERFWQDSPEGREAEGLLHGRPIRADVRNPEGSLADPNGFDSVTPHDSEPVLPVVEAMSKGRLDRRQVRFPAGPGHDRA